jgi:uncharacterized protein HemX
MKSNRKLGFILAGIVVIVIAAAGVIYAADNREVSKQEKLNGDIASNQAILLRGFAEKKAKETETLALADQLVSARQLLEQTSFLASAESIEYDGILFSIANSTGLQVTSLTATPPLNMKEGNITYQATTFTVSVEGITPTTFFTSTMDSTGYIAGVVNNVLAYINKVATSEDFATAMIQSVTISAPETMTEKEIVDMTESIYSRVESELTEAETEGKTEEQITELVKNKLSTMTATQVQWLIDEAGLTKPTAVITIKIWTHKGA